MNYCWLNKRGTRFRLGALLCFGMLTLALSSTGQTNRAATPRTNPPTSERFLLIVETSAAMQKYATNVQRIVGYVFSSGLTGQLESGDTIGAWTYNNELHTGGFPLKRWTPQSSRLVASSLMQFVQKQQYSKPARLGPVMAQLTNVVADSDRITVILISDGSEPVVGTPFDAQIAESFKLNAAEQRRQFMPFVTVLRAVKGKFVGVRVNTPPWPFEVPAFPAETEPLAATPTNSPPPAKENTPPIKPVVAPEPLPVKVETTNAATPATNPPTVAVTPPPVERPTNPPPAVTVTPPPVETNVPPTQVAAANPSPKSTAAPAAPVISKERKLPLVPLVIVAAIVLVGLAAICLVVLGRSRKAPRVSLITRSMNKGGK